MRRSTRLLASAVAIAAGSLTASAGPKIALNVDGQANYSFLAPGPISPASSMPPITPLIGTGYIDGDYKTTWSGPTPTITGGHSSLTVTAPGQGIFHLAHDNPGPNGGGYFQLSLNGRAISSSRRPTRWLELPSANHSSIKSIRSSMAASFVTWTGCRRSARM